MGALEEHTYHTYVAHKQSEQIMQSVVQNRKVHNVDASESRACEVKEKVLREVSGPATRCKLRQSRLRPLTKCALGMLQLTSADPSAEALGGAKHSQRALLRWP